jgi:hypothetical protein
MSTKFFPTSKEVEIEEEEEKQARNFIKEVYRKVKNVKGNLNTIANKIIKDCKNGWPNAPKTFRGRIFFKLNLNEDGTTKSKGGYHGENALVKAQNAVLKRAGRAMVGDSTDDSDWLDLNLSLTPREKEFFDKRLAEYKEDFDLNLSSDMPIVEQVIIEEIVQKRAQVEALKAAKGESVNPSVSKILTETYGRLQKAQEVLGIAGKQRLDKKSYIEGSILDLHKIYIETVKDYPETEIKWQAEELVLMLRKFKRNELTAIDFKNLLDMTPEEGLEKYKEYIDRGTLDKISDSLELDNFNRPIKDLENFDYKNILSQLHMLNEEEALDEIDDD